MRTMEEEHEETKQRDYGEDILEATIESLLAKWEGIEPFHFGEAPESEATSVAGHPTSNLITAGLSKGLLLFNIIRESLINPNKTTVIAKKTGRIIH